MACLTGRYAAAFALWQGTRLVRGGQNNTVPLLTIPALAVTAWAFWKEQAQLLAVTLFIAHVRHADVQPPSMSYMDNDYDPLCHAVFASPHCLLLNITHVHHA